MGGGIDVIGTIHFLLLIMYTMTFSTYVNLILDTNFQGLFYHTTKWEIIIFSLFYSN